MVDTISMDSFEAELDDALVSAHVSREEFIERGLADELEDEGLRALWLIAGPVLTSDG